MELLAHFHKDPDFIEALDERGDFFLGFPSVDLADVGQAYVRSIEGKQTGQFFTLA